MVLAWFSDEEWKDVISNPINWSKSKLNLPGAFAKKKKKKVTDILDAFCNFVEITCVLFPLERMLNKLTNDFLMT